MASSPTTQNPVEPSPAIDPQSHHLNSSEISSKHHHHHHHHHHHYSHPHNHSFDLKVVRDSFVNCIQADNILLLREYVRAYEELCIFVASLGAVFEWAIKDLNHKLIILREHQHLDSMHYHSIQSMVEYEVQSGRVQHKETTIMIAPGKPLLNGCRTLLRLHRALAFISSFLSQMRVAPDDASSASIAWNAYSSTLGQFHSWPVRHTIHAAIKLTVPNRQTLIDKLLNRRNPDEIDALSEDIVRSCDAIERITQELFDSHHLTKLP